MGETEPDYPEIIFSDTTLRDGEQMPGASLRPDQKVRIARALAGAGVRAIEAGFPACARSEVEAVRRVATEVEGVLVSALCRTLPADVDAAAEAFADTPRKRCAVSLFVSTSPLHREHKLNKTKSQLLELIANTVAYARRFFDRVAFGPEDATNTELPFLCEVYREAIAAGATAVGFPDTLGVLTPERVRDMVRRIQDGVPELARVPMAGHFHNDLGLATANSLAAVSVGVRVLQCTVNGIGERAGNAAFEEVVMALKLNEEQYRCRVRVDTTKLTALSRLVEELTGIRIGPNKAVVGRNVFATEAGIHQDGILKHPETYVPFPPEQVGADGVRFVLGKHSGRSAISARLRELGFELSGAELDSVVESVREADKGEWANDELLLTRAARAVTAAG